MKDDFGISVRNTTLKALPEYTDIFQSMISVHYHGLELTEHLRSRGGLDARCIVTLRLMSEVGRSLDALYDLWLRGYYYQASAIGRTVYEVWLTCGWLRSNPERADYWLKDTPRGQMPRFSDMANILDNDPNTDGMAARARDWYERTSSYVHPRFRTVLFATDSQGVTFSRHRAEDIAAGLIDVCGLSFLPLRDYVSVGSPPIVGLSWYDAARRAHLKLQALATARDPSRGLAEE